jgi:hypothetical protein
MGKAEIGMGNVEVGLWNAEFGMGKKKQFIAQS